jgi:type VI secretion system secreted protein VgrG
MGAAGELPSAEGFAGSLGGEGEEGGEEGGGEEGEGGGEEGGEEGGGEEGGEEGEGEGEGGPADHITRQLGIDQAVNGAIEKGLQTGGDALGDALSKALGLDSEGADGSSAANQDGPNAVVDGVDATDRAKGPGHATALIGGSYTEKVATLKVTASINGVATNIAGAMTQNVGAAKLTMALGNIAEKTDGDKKETALGLVIVSRADETESVKGAKTAMVGGLVYEKIAKDHSIEAKAPAIFIGAFHKIEAGKKITIKCGESEVVIDDSGVTMKAPIVTLTAAKIQFTKGVAEL